MDDAKELLEVAMTIASKEPIVDAAYQGGTDRRCIYCGGDNWETKAVAHREDCVYLRAKRIVAKITREGTGRATPLV